MVSRSIIFGDHILTERVSWPVARALNDFHHAHRDELAQTLAPYGLDVDDIVAPAYERIIREDEAPIFARMANELARQR